MFKTRFAPQERHFVSGSLTFSEFSRSFVSRVWLSVIGASTSASFLASAVRCLRRNCDLPVGYPVIAPVFAKKGRKAKNDEKTKSAFLFRRMPIFGCRTRIRTQTNRVRVCRATFTQSGNIQFLDFSSERMIFYHKLTVLSRVFLNFLLFIW